MTTALADTNLFIRFLTEANPSDESPTQHLFQQVHAKQLTLIWPTVVLAEVVFVLTSKRLYHVPRTEIADLLSPFFKLPCLKIEERAVAERALAIFASTALDLVDAWLVAKAQLGKIKTICSFDTDFQAVSGIHWLNPSVDLSVQGQ